MASTRPFAGTLGDMHDELLRALEGVIDPELGRSVIELDMVRRAELVGGTAEVTIALTVAGCPLRASFQDQVDRALLPLAGVERTALTFDVMTPEEKSALTTKLRGGVAERTPGISVDSKTRVLAVASGKGGVGKSSLSANLAAAFSQLGHRTGILDADVYGHSIPHMLGIHQRPVVVDKMIVPPVRGDLKVMSIGFFLDDNQPVMWRGPMLHRALEQFLSDVHWGELETLVVDMPPGTGDAQLTMAQQVPLKGAVIVSTPQDLALIDARRGVAMFRRVNVPILGIVENMSYFLCPSCGERSDIFSHGGAQREAERMNVPFLGEVPLHMTIREKSDAGLPVVATEPDSSHAKIYRDIAAKIRDQLGQSGDSPAAPKIVIEA
jgi:ATP-binding protein involved in chromosome partitioning